MYKKISKLTIFFSLLALLVAGCATKPTTSTPALTKIKLPMGYIPNVQYAPFYVAVEKGYFAAEGLEIEFDYKFETDGVALVGANELPFSVVSAEQVLLARAQGLPVVYFLAWAHDYPVSIVVKSSSNIQTLQDLKGHKIGLPGMFGASYVGARALLNAAGLKESDVTLESIGFNQVEALATDQVDAVVVYDNNEPVQLKARGIDVRTFPVREYVRMASNGIITNEKTIAENPKLVQGFTNAFLKGLSDTLGNPDEAFEISKKFIPEFKESEAAIQRDVLTASLTYWKASKAGLSDPSAWENMQNTLLDMGMLTSQVDVNKAFTNQFIP